MVHHKQHLAANNAVHTSHTPNDIQPDTSFACFCVPSCQRAVLQRVLSASVTVDGRPISSIQRGLLVLIGLSRTDTVHDCDYIARKLLNLKLFDTPDTAKPWTQSALTLQLDLLLVSQFTLYAELKGNRPDFHTAMPPTDARLLYERFVATVRREYGEGGEERVKDGLFGADMKVELVNDGPVTITLDTDDRKFDKQLAKQSRPFSGGQKRNGHSSPPASTTGVEAVGASTASSAASASSTPPAPLSAASSVATLSDGSYAPSSSDTASSVS